MCHKLLALVMLLPIGVEAEDTRHFRFSDTTTSLGQLGTMSVTFTSMDDDPFGIVDIPATTQFYLEANPLIFEIVGIVLGSDMTTEYSLEVDLNLDPLHHPPTNEGWKRHRVVLGNQNLPNLCSATTMGPGIHEVLQIIVRGTNIGSAAVWIDRTYNRADIARSSFMSAWVGGNFLPPDCLGATNVLYSIDDPADCYNFCEVIATNDTAVYLNAFVTVALDTPSDIGPPPDVVQSRWHQVKGLYK